MISRPSADNLKPLQVKGDGRDPEFLAQFRDRCVPVRHGRLDRAKGEAHHALKNALRIGRQGKIRDRTTEGQHFRIAGLNLLAVIVIYWNTLHLGHAVAQRQSDGLSVPPELLTPISPLGWAHILLTGEY